MVALSHVLWTTGTELDLPAISRAAHAVGAQVLVDGAQSVGQHPGRCARQRGRTTTPSLARSGCSAPMGSGGLWVRPELAGEMIPPMPTFLSVEHDETHALPSRRAPARRRHDRPGDAGRVHRRGRVGRGPARRARAVGGDRAPPRWPPPATGSSRVAGLEVAAGDSGLLAITGRADSRSRGPGHGAGRARGAGSIDPRHRVTCGPRSAHGPTPDDIDALIGGAWRRASRAGRARARSAAERRSQTRCARPGRRPARRRPRSRRRG